jgi:hypothetical protein
MKEPLCHNVNVQSPGTNLKCCRHRWRCAACHCNPSKRPCQSLHA